MKVRSVVLTLLVIVMIALAACAPAAPTEAPPEEAAPAEAPEAEPEEAEELTFGVSLDALFLGRQAEMEGVRVAAEEQGVTLLESVADNDPQQQIAQIESFIAQGVDAIMIVPVDMAAIVTAIDAAEDAGIPVVTFDRKVPDTPYVSYHSGLDSYSDGYACGEYVAGQNDGEPHKILHLLGALNDDNAIQRRDGYEQALADAGADNLEIIQAPTDWNAEKALAAVENAFQADPDIWAVQIPSDFMQDSIKTALENAGRLATVGEEGHVIVCTIDGAEPGYRATVEGWTDGVVALPLGDLGRGALEAAVTVATGGTPEVDDQRFPGTLYTWDNAEANADMIWGAVGALEAGGAPAEELTFGVSLDALFLGRQAEMEGVRVAAEEQGVPAAADRPDRVLHRPGSGRDHDRASGYGSDCDGHRCGGGCGHPGGHL
jgi:ABC-type sugar transport system substrate-binding protein